ncbi:hypothetical protein WJX81_004097 [Elliptochloris bilobata]|uniref:BZIP domain-containing protein n=1 Tax=Elliptochloris bilobata TaxID=381761 RepID=A0AAW1SJI1_9CHLO
MGQKKKAGKAKQPPYDEQAARLKNAATRRRNKETLEKQMLRADDLLPSSEVVSKPEKDATPTVNLTAVAAIPREAPPSPVCTSTGRVGHKASLHASSSEDGEVKIAAGHTAAAPGSPGDSAAFATAADDASAMLNLPDDIAAIEDAVGHKANLHASSSEDGEVSIAAGHTAAAPSSPGDSAAFAISTDDAPTVLNSPDDVAEIEDAVGNAEAAPSPPSIGWEFAQSATDAASAPGLMGESSEADLKELDDATKVPTDDTAASAAAVLTNSVLSTDRDAPTQVVAFELVPPPSPRLMSDVDAPEPEAQPQPLDGAGADADAQAAPADSGQQPADDGHDIGVADAPHDSLQRPYSGMPWLLGAMLHVVAATKPVLFTHLQPAPDAVIAGVLRAGCAAHTVRRFAYDCAAFPLDAALTVARVLLR